MHRVPEIPLPRYFLKFFYIIKHYRRGHNNIIYEYYKGSAQHICFVRIKTIVKTLPYTQYYYNRVLHFFFLQRFNIIGGYIHAFKTFFVFFSRRANEIYVKLYHMMYAKPVCSYNT